MKDKDVILKDNFQRTKIVATIGPASAPAEVLEQLILAGVDVFRLNFSHGKHEEHLEVIKRIKSLNKREDVHIAILADLQGPKIRIGEVLNGSIELVKHQDIILSSIPAVSDTKKLSVSYPLLASDVKPGEHILIDDGKLKLQVIAIINEHDVMTKVIVGGKLTSKKGVNFPETRTTVECLTEKDKEDVKFIMHHNVDWIALSFVRNAKDIKELKDYIKAQNPKQIPGIIAKVEKPEALDDLDAIIHAADAVMVARGDLGVEIPVERVPLVQKTIVQKCIRASRPVIIATQMMESMVTNASPTRAEVNDIANAVLDGADALMLSGETSVGCYPVEAVAYMQKVIAEAENTDSIYYRFDHCEMNTGERLITDHISMSACRMAMEAKINAIVTMTHTGYTAFHISGKRPKAGIFIFTDSRKLLSELSLLWGVRCFYYEKFPDTDAFIDVTTKFLLKEGFVHKGEFIIHIAGIPIMHKGKNNMVKLSVV